MSTTDRYPMRDLTGAHVLITGGTRGIGAHVVAQLAASGAKVVSLARAAPTSPVAGVEYVACDIGSRVAVKKALDDIKASWHYLDIIILNAGVMPGECACQ
jgi:NAD(P)-dependent dehydrogenase (short-subunit alcohol dehydrogenase family)